MRAALSSLVLGALAGCSSTSEPPLEPVPYVDLERFMGQWYVIANIPTRFERDAHNAVESYALSPPHTIETTFSFREGGFDGPVKTYRPTGFVRDTESNALWGMQFIWPIKADYRIIYLDEDYRVTIIGRQKRDYVWLMARSPTIDPVRYQELLTIIGEAGYDLTQVQQVPQRWD